MQRYRVCAVGGVAVSLLSVVSVLGQGAQQPQARIETVYPRHVARGQTTVINVAIPSRDTVQAAEIAGIRAILVHAISETAKRFYESHGFIAAPLDHHTVIITVAERRPVTI